MRIAYFVNQYPKVSHSFIRREICALERWGVQIERMALRGWDAELVDAEDSRERERTRYVLKDGARNLALAAVRMLLSRPARFLAGLRLALKMGQRSDRRLPFHLAYLAEACVMAPWLKQCRATHIHAHFGTNSAEVAMLAGVLSGLPYSFTVHGPEEFDKPEFLGLAEKVRRAAFVVAISSFGRSQLYRWIDRQDWGKVKIVHCGLEQSFHDVPHVPIPDAPTLVCVGRLCEQKGQLLLVHAAHVLARRGITFKLVLAGDGEMRAEIEDLVRDRSLTDIVVITGWISSDQVRKEVLAARALVLPSFAEGLPVVIMEAMALRRPVLTTYVAGIPELVRPEENGWLFSSGSVEELAAAMEACLAAPRELLERMGEQGRRRVLERHDMEREAGRIAVHFHHAMHLSTPGVASPTWSSHLN